MIRIENLTKVYKLSKRQMQKQKTKLSTKIAVNDVSLTANAGEIFGLLGPNGAGKTTTLRCLATLLKPTDGRITIDDIDVVEQPDKIREKLGFLTGEIKLDDQFSVNYLVEFFGRLHGIPEDILKERKKKLFDYFGLNGFMDKKIEELSTGMKQKAAIAVCLIHDPEIVIFDEPTSGLDIVTARLVLDYLKVLRDEGKLVIISTHIMSEAERLCDRVAIIIDGKKVCDATLPEIYSRYNVNNLEDAFFEMYKLNHKEEA